MTEMDRLQDVIAERFRRRPAGIDKLDRLWDAAVLIPLVKTEQGISILFENVLKDCGLSPGKSVFPEAGLNAVTEALILRLSVKPVRSWALILGIYLFVLP